MSYEFGPASSRNSVDPIRARREAAEKALDPIGRLSELQVAALVRELHHQSEFELGIARVIRASIYRPHQNDISQVTRLLVGGYTRMRSGSLSPAVNKYDRQDGSGRVLSDYTWNWLEEQANRQTRQISLYTGGNAVYERDIVEWLIAKGRDEGLPVLDPYRRAGEPPLSGVRGMDPAEAHGRFYRAS